jgi:hypothetical protein
MTITDFAQVIGKSKGWVHAQIEAGMPAGEEGGQGHGGRKIDFAAAAEWLVGQAGRPRQT